MKNDVKNIVKTATFGVQIDELKKILKKIKEDFKKIKNT
jgi:hypothetical protein